MNSAIAASAGPVLPCAHGIGSERTHAERVACPSRGPGRNPSGARRRTTLSRGSARSWGGTLPTWDTYRCAEGPVINFYHGAYYGEEPPALYRGYAYRPHYRYSAYRRLPRKYFCVSD
ncbi:hypothetical protein [Bradyrhizobium sp. F1.13.3]|uniref:hypothetical protein n=1 Tax=Bradyrhizobium sp. F1.13.3 TaxID=3156351 RepID=UPI003390C881